ncbi:IS66 family insertion sequence element accessory protein TnpB [Duganella sp. HH105]|uniref:IS66 family insertion sequence element accessory protein TnpB n=1 Tax=Duganella sp. HH105 TaxID=1781067 RepID=UPI00143C1545|nr:IS66 family insertion sequence element accessory protein TnpB [Duganella sp. HH105]
MPVEAGEEGVGAVVEMRWGWPFGYSVYGYEFLIGHFRQHARPLPQHPLEFKRALAALSLNPGASVACIVREPAGTKVWPAAGTAGMCSGFNGLAAMVQTMLEEYLFSGHVFVFRGRRGVLIKLIGPILVKSLIGRGESVLPLSLMLSAKQATYALPNASVATQQEGQHY